MEYQKSPFKSSIFRLTNTAQITATESQVIQSTSTVRDVLDFGPFNHFVLKNLSVAPIVVKINGDSNKAYRLNGSEQIQTDSDDKILFDFLMIENIDGAVNIAIGEIDATYLRKPEVP